MSDKKVIVKAVAKEAAPAVKAAPKKPLYNPKGEFTNTWFKMDCQYLNSMQENFVVFFAAAA